MMRFFLLLLISLLPITTLAVVELTTQQFYRGIQRGDYDIVIDVRTQGEWDTGHIENATLVENLAQGGDRHLPLLDCREACKIAVYCRSGSRARAAAAFLESKGFSKPVYNGQGVNQWTGAGYSLVTTSSYQPPCLANPQSYVRTCDLNTGGGFGGVCFSADMEVQVKDGKPKKMKQVQVGDQVLVQHGRYETVYTLAHVDHAQKAIFVRLEPMGLELSEQHMVYVKNQGRFVPASQVMVGDELVVSSTSTTSIVSSIQHVTRQGVYAPFTKSGTIVVHNVLASTFVAPSRVRSWVDFQWLARTFQLGHYHGLGSSKVWIHYGQAFGEWWVRQNVFMASMVLVPVWMGLVLLQAMDVVLELTGMTVGGVLLVWYTRRVVMMQGDGKISK